MMKQNKIFVACDSTNISKIKNIIKETQKTKIKFGYKFGLEFLNSKNGRDFLHKLKNKITFADLKLHDIPNTHYKTGIEMEALTGVAAGLLCAFDMVKSLEKDEEGQYPVARITDLEIVEKFKGL